MANKIIGFAHSDSDNLSYIKNQLDAIKIVFPSLEIELSDESNSLVAKHIAPALRDRMPLYMILKDGHYKTHRHGKFSNEQVIHWIQNLPTLNA